MRIADRPNLYGLASVILILTALSLALAACNDFTATPVPVSVAIVPGQPAIATSVANIPSPIPPSPATNPATRAAITPSATAKAVTVPLVATPTNATSAATPGADSTLQTLDLSFIDANQGWALFSNCQGATCQAALKMTGDGGQTWHSRPAPSVEPGFFLAPGQSHNQVARIYFANAQDGWLFGSAFYSTHDGGVNWQAGRFSEDIIELILAGPTILAVTRACLQPSNITGCNYGLLSSTDSGHSWQKRSNFPAIPGPQAQLLALSGRDFWLLSSGTPSGADTANPPTLAVTHDGGEAWQTLTNPCTKKGWVEARLALANPQNLWLLCASIPGAGQQLKFLFKSGDGGQSWQAVGTMAGTAAGYLSSFTASEPGKLWLALTRYTLLTSDDAGLNWQPAFPLEKANPSNGRIGPVIFTDAKHGWFAADQGRVFYTADGGTTWLPGALK